MKLKWSIIALSALLLTGCSTLPSAAAPKPNIRQIFLNYVPPNEPGAPHDMEWIVEHFIGDGGYYGSGHTPGSLSVSTTNLQAGSYTINWPHPHVEQVTRVYEAHWSIANASMIFYIFAPKNEVVAINQDAKLAMAYPYMQALNKN